MTLSDMGKEQILVADDDSGIRWVLQKFLKEKGFDVVSTEDGSDALERFRETPISLALIDIKMPKLNGLEVLREIKKIDKDTPVIIITAQDTMANAIEAIKSGAFDYISKPFDLDELEVIIEKALRSQRTQKELFSLRKQFTEQLEKEAVLIGNSPAMQEVFKKIGRLADKDVPVLITGESGTGKEVLAKVIHLESKRASGPFIPINSAAIPDDLIESELFGFEKGAFTGAVSEKPGKLELANGGTLFLDEIGDMTLHTQAKVLRVLQDRELYRVGGKRSIRIDARFITATHHDLKRAIEEGRFREDLFYRINVVNIELPPLRKRKEDIPHLTDHFLRRFAKEMGMGEKVLSPEALELLYRYDWPGNVRELENVLKGAYVLSPTAVITEECLTLLHQRGQGDILSLAGNLSKKQGGAKGEENLEEFFKKLLKKIVPKAKRHIKGDLYEMVIGGVEKTLIELVLDTTDWNQLQASKILGINRNTLRKKIRELKITPKKKKV